MANSAFTWVSNRNQIVRGEYDRIELLVVERSERVRADVATEIAAQLNETVVLRGMMKRISLIASNLPLAKAPNDDIGTLADAALCAHEWVAVTVGGPLAPTESDIACSACGVNQYAFYQMIGLEE